MSVIHRIELVNSLNLDNQSPGTAGWEPHWRAVVIEPAGVNTAVKLPNGEGKTSVNNAYYGLLLRRPDFVRKLKSILAPKRHGQYSHFRIEFTYDAHTSRQGQLIGASVEGERYVFAMYGYTDDVAHFYHYRGTLEELPVHSVAGKLVRLATNREFDERRKNVPMLCDPGTSKEDWRKQVFLHVDQHTLEKGADYQSKGGGDGAETLFNLKTPAGTKYDTEFFYRHMAPEILIGCMRTFGDKGEHRFEDTLLKSAEPLVLNELSLTEKEKEVEALNLVHGRLRRAAEHVGQFASARSERLSLAATHFAETQWLRNVVLEDPLPGVPRPLKERGEETRFLCDRLVVDGGRWLLPDAVLASLLDEPTSALNQRAVRDSCSGSPLSSQVIENPCDLNFSRASKGHRNQGYTREHAVALIEKAGRFADGWTRDAIGRALQYAFDEREGPAECNPLRAQLRETTRLEEDHRAALTAHKSRRTDLGDEARTLESQLQSLEANEAALRRMEDSGLFEPEDLRQPAATKRSIQHCLADAEVQRDALSARRTELAPARDAFVTVSAHFGTDERPDAIRDRVSALPAERRVAMDGATQSMNGLVEARADSLARLGDAKRAHRETQAQHLELQRRRPLALQFREIFEPCDPQGLREVIAQQHEAAVGEVNRVTHALVAAQAEQGQLVEYAERASRYAGVFGEVSPEGLDVLVRREHEDAQRRSAELTSLLADTAHRLAKLEDGQRARDQVQTAFPHRDLTQLEDELTIERLELAAEAARLRTHLEELDVAVGAWDAFETLFGEGACATTVRAERRERWRACHASETTLEAEVAALHAQMEDLRTAGTAAGPMARRVRDVLVRDGAAPIPSVHEVVRCLDLNPTLTADVLAVFSQVLHAPVVADLHTADRVLGVLEVARLDYPVFDRQGLESYCRQWANPVGHESVVRLLLGRMTPAVEMLLDPVRVAERFADLEVEAETASTLLASSRVEREALGEESATGRLVQAAERAQTIKARSRRTADDAALCVATQRQGWLAQTLDGVSVDAIRRAANFAAEASDDMVEEARLSRQALADSRDALDGVLPALRDRFDHLALILAQRAYLRAGGPARQSELALVIEADGIALAGAQRGVERLVGLREHLHLVDDALDYERLGGDARFDTVDVEQAATSEQVRTLQVDIDSLQGRIDVAEQVVQRASALAYAAQTTWDLWQRDLHRAIQFVTDGGESFEATYDATMAGWQSRIETQKARTFFNFEGAEAGARLREHVGHEDALRTRGLALRGELAVIDRAIILLEKEIEELRGRSEVLRDTSRRIDASVARLLKHWDTAATILSGFDADTLAAIDVTTLNAHVRASQVLRGEIPSAIGDPGRLATLVEEICENVAGFAIHKGDERLRELRRTEDRGLKDACRVAEELVNDPSAKLSGTERAELDHNSRPRESVAENLLQLERNFAEFLASANQRVIELKTDLASARERFHLSMAGFAKAIPENLRIMKKCLRPSNELASAGLLLEVEVAGEEAIREATNVVADYIRQFIEEQRAREKRALVTRAGAKREELRDEIGQAFFRTVFRGPAGSVSGPIVKLQHPSIALGKAERLTPKLSVGQKNAVFLMIMIKLADFAQEQQLLQDGSPSAHAKRKVRSSRVLMVDGLFSNLSKRSLITPSLEAIKDLRGNFQLVGWIHNQLYENDPSLFPSYVSLRRYGRDHGFVAKHQEFVAGEMVALPMRATQLPPPVAPLR